MILNYKFRLYPTKKQESKLNQQFFVATQSWNYALNIRNRDIHTKTGFTPRSSIENYIKTKLTVRNIKYHSGILQNSVMSLENSFKIFWKQRKKGNTEKGFPKFKKSNFLEQSFEFKNQGFQFSEKHFKILKMKIKWNYHREIPSRVKKIIVKREADGKFYVIFSIKVEENILEKTSKSCGIDLNVKNIAVATSSGKTYLKTITKIEKYSKKYKKLQKVLSKRYEEVKKSKKKVSKNTKKLQKKQNKIYKKVRNVKEDFFNKVSNEIVKNFDHIKVEKLEVKNMKEKAPSKRLRRDIAEVSWSSLIEKLKYKSERYGRVFEEINPAYTSQRCNQCGKISSKNRKTQAEFKCIKCGYKANADCNAAKNILEYKEWFLEQKTRWDSRHTESSETS